MAIRETATSLHNKVAAEDSGQPGDGAFHQHTVLAEGFGGAWPHLPSPHGHGLCSLSSSLNLGGSGVTEATQESVPSPEGL